MKPNKQPSAQEELVRLHTCHGFALVCGNLKAAKNFEDQIRRIREVQNEAK